LAAAADAFMDLVRTALAHVGDRHAVGADRYLVHVVSDRPDGGASMSTGTRCRPRCWPGSVVTRPGWCTTSGVTRCGWGGGPGCGACPAPGDHGARCGTCRFPGCTRTVCDIHHVRPWADGGVTDVDNGMLVCTRHHTLLHEQFTATGDANATITVYRHDGTVVASTRPLRRFPAAA